MTTAPEIQMRVGLTDYVSAGWPVEISSHLCRALIRECVSEQCNFEPEYDEFGGPAYRWMFVEFDTKDGLDRFVPAKAFVYVSNCRNDGTWAECYVAAIPAA